VNQIIITTSFEPLILLDVKIDNLVNYCEFIELILLVSRTQYLGKERLFCSFGIFERISYKRIVNYIVLNGPNYRNWCKLRVQLCLMVLWLILECAGDCAIIVNFCVFLGFLKIT